MNIQFEKVGNVSGELTLQIEKADYEAKVNKSLKEMGRKAQMPGFRPGKVPAGLVKKMYGTQVKAEEMNKLLQDSLFNYIKENNINMLGEPLASEKQTPQDIETQEVFTFIFDIALAPEFSIALNNEDTIDYYDIEVSDEMVTKQLDALRQQAGHPEEAETYADRDILRGVLAELDAEGKPLEGGVVVESASLMPSFFKNDDQKKIFEGAQKNAVLTFNPNEAYNGNETELASLLKIEKDAVKEHTGNFSFEIHEISRFVPAELNEEFFSKVFGEDVKTEEDARAKVEENIQLVQQNDSDYKFLLDVRKYAEEKVGELTFPEATLKRIMLENNKDRGADFVEKNFDASIKELKWHLIREQLAEAQGVKVEDADVKNAAKEMARAQFAQYGMNNVPDEYLENYAAEMLKKRETVDNLVERAVDRKLTEALKNVVKLNKKTVSLDDFNKMMSE